MVKKIEYTDAKTFMFACVRYGAFPAIHWRDDTKDYRGFIWFKPSSNYVVKEGEAHVFFSSDKKVLDSIWNSIGLIKHAVKLVEGVDNV